jgi:hypothetical protein
MGTQERNNRTETSAGRRRGREQEISVGIRVYLVACRRRRRWRRLVCRR